MKLMQAQHSAIYTLILDGNIYIRNMSKFIIDEKEDELLWYSTERGFTEIVTDEEKISELEELFANILE